MDSHRLGNMVHQLLAFHFGCHSAGTRSVFFISSRHQTSLLFEEFSSIIPVGKPLKLFIHTHLDLFLFSLHKSFFGWRTDRIFHLASIHSNIHCSFLPKLKTQTYITRKQVPKLRPKRKDAVRNLLGRIDISSAETVFNENLTILDIWLVRVFNVYNVHVLISNCYINSQWGLEELQRKTLIRNSRNTL